MPYFGEIKNQKLKYSLCSALAYTLWNKIPNRTQNVELGEMIVVPNHICGILILSGNDTKIYTPPRPKDPKFIEQIVEKISVISPKSNSVSAIVRSYKSAVTQYTNRMGLLLGWQFRFYDYIIRDDKAYCRIKKYIKTNFACSNPKS